MDKTTRIFYNLRFLILFFLEKDYIYIELFDKMQSATVQRSYMVAKLLPITSFLSVRYCLQIDIQKFLIRRKGKEKIV